MADNGKEMINSEVEKRCAAEWKAAEQGVRRSSLAGKTPNSLYPPAELRLVTYPLDVITSLHRGGQTRSSDLCKYILDDNIGRY